MYFHWDMMLVFTKDKLYKSFKSCLIASLNGRGSIRAQFYAQLLPAF